MACSVAKCEICGKDLCNKCIGYEANTMGDYREVYCNKCWELGTEYRLKIEQLEKIYIICCFFEKSDYDRMKEAEKLPPFTKKEAI